VQRIEIAMVDACLRDGRGGSPTGVVVGGPALDAAARIAVARAIGGSHVAFVARGDASATWHVAFATRERELASCGHGTVAAHARLVDLHGDAAARVTLRAGGRALRSEARRAGDAVEVRVEQGLVALRPASGSERQAMLAAAGIAADELVSDHPPAVASPGAARLLAGIRAEVLERLAPDMEALRAASERHGLLGLFAWAPVRDGRLRARMFAPAIGVAEDVANANSSGCLAALLLAAGGEGATEIAVDQGDALGVPATVAAWAERTRDGMRTAVGGRARAAAVVPLVVPVDAPRRRCTRP
jgi:trans-2,3-dihydro-3-hydroxyanthranilate isomerase